MIKRSMGKALTVYVGVIALSACGITVISNESIPLSSVFTNNATKIDVPKPTSLFFDSGYNVAVGNFEVSHTNISGKRDISEKTDRSINTNLVESLLFGQDWLVDTQEYDVVSSQKFSFDIATTNSEQTEVLIPTLCETNALANKRVSERVFGDKEQGSSTSVQSVQLKCKITISGEEYLLFMLHQRNDSPFIRLLSAKHSLTLKTEYRSVGVKRDQSGNSSSFSRKQNRDLMGVTMFENTQQVGAISFATKPSIWYLNSLSKAHEGLIVAASYSLIMHKRLNRDWIDLRKMRSLK